MDSTTSVQDFTESGLFEALWKLGIRGASIDYKMNCLNWVDKEKVVVDFESPILRIKERDVEVLPLGEDTYLRVVDEFIPQADHEGSVVDSYGNSVPQLWSDHYHKTHLIQKTIFSLYQKKGWFRLKAIGIKCGDAELDEIVLSTQWLSQGWNIATMTQSANASYTECDTVIFIPDSSKPGELKDLEKIHWVSGSGFNKGPLAFDYHQQARAQLIDMIAQYNPSPIPNGN